MVKVYKPLLAWSSYPSTGKQSEFRIPSTYRFGWTTGTMKFHCAHVKKKRPWVKKEVGYEIAKKSMGSPKQEKKTSNNQHFTPDLGDFVKVRFFRWWSNWRSSLVGSWLSSYWFHTSSRFHPKGDGSAKFNPPSFEKKNWKFVCFIQAKQCLD